MIELKQLAFFIGSECLIDGQSNQRRILCGITTTLLRVCDPAAPNITWPIERRRIKPILRPFSDMTEEENEYVQSIVNRAGLGYSAKYAAEITAYLASRHFDLFGWIEQGLAIAATKKEVEP
jgi:hypothetical protein